MHRVWTLLTFVCCLTAAAIAAPPHFAGRLVMSLDSDWRFHQGNGDAIATSVGGVAVSSWQWQPVERADADHLGLLLSSVPGAKSTEVVAGGAWKDVAPGADVFSGRVGFAIFRTVLPRVKPPLPVLHFDGVDDNGTVFLNGKLVVTHEGWNEAFDAPLAGAWNPSGPNVCVVVVENTNGPGGITAPVRLEKPGQSVPTSPLANESFDDKAWETVQLPHDYVIEGPFSPTADGSHGYLPTQVAWYRKSFMIPFEAKGKSVWIDFEGIYRDSRIWINGHFLGRHESGYTSFRYDLSPFLKYGQSNSLAVFVDPRSNEGWWYEGGGIYRHVWLTIANPVHLRPWGTVVSTDLPQMKPAAGADLAIVKVKTTVSNGSSRDVNLTVDFRILDAGHDVVEHFDRTVFVKSGTDTIVNEVASIKNPHLWSIDDPHRYQLVTRVIRKRVAIDEETTAFGIRTIHFDAQRGFFLNGKSVKIQGVCNHQDFAGLGIAVPDNFEFWRVAKMKMLGANAWRMSHNPPTPALLDACDALGMLVMDENRHLGDSPRVLSEVAALVKRDINHPSVIMWSMCNEESAAGTKRGGKIFTAMKNVVLRYDRTRPVTCAMNSGWFGNGFTDVVDLMGVNYNYQVYDEFHAKHPGIALFGSETASTLTTRGQYQDDPQRTFVSSYNLTDDSWIPAGQRPFVAGTFVWTGFDYKGEPTPYQWPDVNSHFGILDMCGFPKDNYYYYQAWWKSTPMVHIMPHWTWPGKEDSDIKVVVFSNASKVELFLNGQSLGMNSVPALGHLEWTLKYRPGKLEARAYNDIGDTVAQDVAETVGPAVGLRVSREVLPGLPTDLRANGQDVAALEVDVVDAKGHIVPDAENLVNFSVSGAGQIAGVGNGNPSDHDPDHGTSRHAFGGKCMVLLRAGRATGLIRVQVTSTGLSSADYTVSLSDTVGR